MKQAYFEKIDTALGPLAVTVDAGGRLLAVAFLNEDHKPGISQTWPKTRAALEQASYKLSEDPARTSAVRSELAEYFAGRRRDFDVEVAPHGSEFQQEIWRLLLAIPYGETRTYSELAAASGRGPQAARAVGRAVATNPISIVIPCHRVVGADGSLTGFAGGLRFKRGLLDLEQPTLFSL